MLAIFEHRGYVMMNPPNLIWPNSSHTIPVSYVDKLSYVRNHIKKDCTIEELFNDPNLAHVLNDTDIYDSHGNKYKTWRMCDKTKGNDEPIIAIDMTGVKLCKDNVMMIFQALSNVKHVIIFNNINVNVQIRTFLLSKFERVELIDSIYMTLDISRHYLQAKFTKIDHERCPFSVDKLPRLYDSDMMCKYSGFFAGDVLMCETDCPTNGKSIEYRVVVRTPLLI